jgi:hypothetical protein
LVGFTALQLECVGLVDAAEKVVEAEVIGILPRFLSADLRLRGRALPQFLRIGVVLQFLGSQQFLQSSGTVVESSEGEFVLQSGLEVFQLASHDGVPVVLDGVVSPAG